MDELKDEYKKMEDILEVKEPKKYPILPAGLYRAVYAGTQKRSNEEGSYYRHKWIMLNEGKETDRFIFENSSLSLSSKSKLGEMFKACGHELKLGELLNISWLVGKVCDLYVEIDDKGYNRIKNHIPIKSPDSVGAFV